jgi:hypothetical protein
MVGLSPSVIANSYAVGAALLALWLFLRFPNRGPARFEVLASSSSALAGCCSWLGR